MKMSQMQGKIELTMRTNQSEADWNHIDNTPIPPVTLNTNLSLLQIHSTGRLRTLHRKSGTLAVGIPVQRVNSNEDLSTL